MARSASLALCFSLLILGTLDQYNGQNNGNNGNNNNGNNNNGNNNGDNGNTNNQGSEYDVFCRSKTNNNQATADNSKGDSCNVFCQTSTGSNRSSKSYMLKNGTQCSLAYLVDDDPMECFNGQCVFMKDWQQCTDNMQNFGGLTAVNLTGCTVTCVGTGNPPLQKTINRPAGDICLYDASTWIAGTCDSNGVCNEEVIYVSDPGNHWASADWCQDICNRRHASPGVQAQLSTIVLNDFCKFSCASNASSPLSVETLTFANWVACGNNKACMGGKCQDMDALQMCLNEDLGPLIDLQINECMMTCVVSGNMNLNSIIPAINGIQCVQGSSNRTGTCDGSGTCITPKSGK